MKKYKAIGVMSGTSLDGLDMAYAEFSFDTERWSYQLGAYEEILYGKEWQDRLSKLSHETALEFVQTHVKFGHYMGELIHSFLEKNKLDVDVIGVHGHTIFHQPENGFTSQIGDGSVIASKTKNIVACDFRSMDVARGGQGAPLVPIGDALLFSDYVARLNLGGFSNISFGGLDDMTAFDICPVNIVMNEITRNHGLEYDEDGKMARGGQINQDLLNKLNQLEFYQQKGPKSLGREWVDKYFWPMIPNDMTDVDVLRTLVEHISTQIAICLESYGVKWAKVLVTGGGAYNGFLMERISSKTSMRMIIPEPSLVEMKEALIFAFLGVLRTLELPNTLSSVTGAKSASISGALYNGV